MNIFEVLQLGNSSIREVNITALLGYFLNKHANHSIGDKLLCKVISIIDDNHNSILKKYSNSETIIEHNNIDIYIKLFNEEVENYHDARVDIICCGRCFLKMIDYGSDLFNIFPDLYKFIKNKE